MSWRTSKLIVVLRNMGRTLGVNSVVANLISGKNYEDRFQTAMLGSIRSGDVVWDVGANIGLYTKAFATLVGDRGMVIAFEPSPINLQKLRMAADVPNVRVMPFGLGARDEDMVFEQGEDELGATSRFVGTCASTTGNQMVIRVLRGDSVVEFEDVPLPNVVKIDTEGFELDVLRGMAHVLENIHLRTVCIEVHFGLLEARGLGNAAAEIEEVLAQVGFAITWPDSSHVVATKST